MKNENEKSFLNHFELLSQRFWSLNSFNLKKGSFFNNLIKKNLQELRKYFFIISLPTIQKFQEIFGKKFILTSFDWSVCARTKQETPNMIWSISLRLIFYLHLILCQFHFHDNCSTSHRSILRLLCSSSYLIQVF